jgi:hypothetical protein
MNHLSSAGSMAVWKQSATRGRCANPDRIERLFERVHSKSLARQHPYPMTPWISERESQMFGCKSRFAGICVNITSVNRIAFLDIRAGYPDIIQFPVNRRGYTVPDYFVKALTYRYDCARPHLNGASDGRAKSNFFMGESQKFVACINS